MEELVKMMMQEAKEREERHREDMQLAKEREERHREDMRLLVERLMARPEAIVGGTADQKAKNLADQMVSFVYDPENNMTFESWFDRYKSIFETEVAAWEESAKMRLLLQKFSQADYQKFADSLLPQLPTQLTVEAAVSKLKAMFGYRETKFAMRHKCFSLKKEEAEDFIQFASRINRNGEKFDVTHCTADDLKVLLFVSGLKSPGDSVIMEKLLSKIDMLHVKLEAAADDAARALIPKLTLDDLVNEAQRLISLKKDKSTVADSSSVSHGSEVFAIQDNKNWRSKKPAQVGNFSRSAKVTLEKYPNCRYCGGGHLERECGFKDKHCNVCKVLGHKAGHCVTASEAGPWKKRFGQQQERHSMPKRQNSDTEVRQVIDNVLQRSNLRKFISPSINGAKIRLQLDSASDVTIISETSWKKLGKPTLTKVSTQPGSASGHSIHLWGSFPCQMKLNSKAAPGICFVSSRLDLLGIDWISKLGLWDVPFSTICNSVAVNPVSAGLATEAELAFPDLFTEGLGLCTKTKVSLTLKPDSQKIFRKARPVPFAAAPAIEEEIKRQQHLGVFTAVSYSDYAAPIVAVKKKNGKIRICGDYSTGLNNSLESNQFPLPTADQIFASLANKKIFSVIDLSDAFLQMELDDEAKKLLTVNTHVGLFQVNRMQPGVKTAPGMFQELMTKMLSNLGDAAIAFIDDIILGAATEAEHKKVLFNVLERIQDYGFKLRIEKCNFGQESIKFCGHIIDSQGTRPDPEKIQAIKKIPRPEDVSQLRSFLGAANYYGKFVKRINEIRGPLDELTQKDVKFQWTKRHQEAFEEIKEVLGSNLVLTHYDPAKPIVVAADASQYGKGGAIMHRFPDRTLHPVMFVSSSFNAAEKNYPQIQREAAALIFTVKRFHKYLYGRKFELQTDHKPLLSIFGSKTGIPAFTASRLQRYALTLLAYDFTVTYIDTASFGYVDVVSRLIAKHPREEEDTVIAAIQFDKPQCWAIETAKTLPVKFADIQEATERCPTLTKVTEFVQSGWPDHKKHVCNQAVAEFFDQRSGLDVIEKCVFQDERIVIPAQFREKVLAELHIGHPGLVRMKMLARSKVYWPRINDDIERTVKTCTTCAKIVKSPIKCTLQSWPIPTSPWSRIHADYAGPVDGFFYMVIVDSYSNWPEIFKTSSTTSSKTIELFSEAFARNGLCDTLVTDNGPQFTSAEFKNFVSTSGINHLRTAPYHPQSNGKAEKFVDLLKTGLAKAEGNADQKLREFLTTYRFMPSYSLGGKSPSELMNNRSMKTRLDLLHPPPQPSTTRNSAMEARFNEAHGAKWKKFDVGACVYYKLHKSNDVWTWAPGKITERIGQVNYSVELSSGRIIPKAHANQLKLRHVQNEISKAFGFADLSDEEVEPTIIPLQQEAGVKTAPGMFQELMTKMLSNLGGNVMAFIDDIILGAPTEAEHEKLLFQVLQRIQDYGFKLRIEKCNFGQPTIKFCGHIVDQHGTRPDPTKIQAIQSIPAPKDVSQLRSFLGAANYYGKFVKSINAIRGPLDELTHKDVKFVWEAKHQEAFEKIKAVLASDLILTHYDPAKPIVVAADACQYGKGGAIMHRFPDGTLHPVMFVSESFNAAERNYPQIQREAAALVFTVKRFHKFLYGRKFELQTDHKPLVAIFGSKEGIPVFTASRLQRYALTLLAYDFTVTYIDTASFGYVDVVSRLIAKHPRETDENTIIAQITIDEQQCFAIETAKMLPINFTDIKSENLQCPIMQQVKSYVEGGWPAKKKHIRDAEVAKYFDQRNELIVIEGCLFRGDRIVIPAQYRKQVLQELHTGHPGLVRSKMLARSKVYWPNIDEDIERTVKCCETCATVPKSPIKCTLKSWPVPSKPWSRIHADYAGPVNGQFYLVIVDAYSNWPEVFKTASTTSTKTIELFSEVFTRNGLCDTLVTDNGSQFISAEFKNFTDSNGIEHLRTAPYHPQSNGKAEKFVDLLKTGLSKADGNADQKLREFLSVYRRTPSYTLGGKSPSELINGRPMKTTLDLLQPPPKQSALRNDTMEQQFNEFHGAKWKEFAVGDRVYFKIHSSNTSWKWTPARIIAIVGRVNYTIELETGKIIRKAHANQLKKRHISNEIIDTFGLLDITTEEVEPTITPAQRELTHELTDENVSEPSSGEESFASADDEPGEVGPLQPKPEPAIRRTTRINAGIPAQRFGYND